MIDTSQILIDAARARTITTSAKVQITNVSGRYDFFETGKYAMFEGDGIELDGTSNVLKKTEVLINYEGWYSEFPNTILSDENANFENVEFTNYVQHDKKEISDLHIIFSNVRNEYAINFDVIVTKDGESTTYNFTENTKKEVVLNNIATGSKITIKFYKWSKHFARAKVLSCCLGTLYQYDDDEIMSITAKKGVDLINENIESKEIEIKLTDINDTYNIFKTNTEWDLLDEDAIIRIFLGIVIDNFIYYVKVDECYFKKVEKKDNEIGITITGMGILSKYQNIEWVKLYDEVYLVTKDLTVIKDAIDKDFSTLKEKIKIDNELIQEKQEMLRCFEKNVKIHEYFNKLATNCRSNLIETFDNNILFKRIKESQVVAKINLENMEEEPDIEKQEKFNTLIKKYNYSEDSEKQEVFKGKFTLNQYGYAVLNTYADVELTFPVSTMSGGSTSDELSFILNVYNKDGSVYKSNITSTDNQDFELVVSLNVIYFICSTLKDKIFELTLNCKTLRFSSCDYKITNYDTCKEERTIDIRSIQDEETAKKVGMWLANNLNKRFKYKIKINDTFTYELGDTVELETGVYVNDEMITRKALVTGIEYEYDGALDYYLILEGE